MRRPVEVRHPRREETFEVLPIRLFRSVCQRGSDGGAPAHSEKGAAGAGLEGRNLEDHIMSSNASRFARPDILN